MARRQRRQLLLQQLPHRRHMGRQVAAAELLGHGERGAAGQGIAAEGAGVLTGLEQIGRGLHAEGADRHATPEALGQGDGIGLHPELLIAPQAAGAADAHLHLIEDQQDVVLIAELAHAAEEGRIAGVHAALALQGLQQHRRHPRPLGLAVAQQHLEGGRVVVGEVAEALHHRLKALVVLRLAGGGDGRQGAAVEAGLGREDQWAALGAAIDAAHHVAVLAGQLDRRLIGLGAGIAEEDLVGAAVGGDPGRQLLLLRDPVEVGHVLQPPQLARQRPPHHRAAVAEGADGDAGHAIEIALALAVPQPDAAAAHQLDREAPVGVHHRRVGRCLARRRRDRCCHGSGGTRTHMPEGARF